MMTQTHILMAAALFAKPGDRSKTAIAILGGFLPDAMLSGLFVAARMQGVSANEIFNKLFWSEQWSNLMAPGNSFVLYLVLLLLGYWLMKSTNGWARVGVLTIVFSVSALLHLITDFLLHAEDARTHFWPLANWIFHSPVSYWDSKYYGTWFQPFELIMGLLFLAILFGRFSGAIVRIFLASTIVLYLAIPAYFYFTHHGA